MQLGEMRGRRQSVFQVISVADFFPPNSVMGTAREKPSRAHENINEGWNDV